MSGTLSSSKVWNFFKKAAGGKPTAKCNICAKEYKTSGNTTNLIDHMRRIHKSEWDKFIQNEPGTSVFVNQRPLKSYFSSKDVYDVNSSRHKALSRKLVAFIAKDFQPLCVVEDAGFKDFIFELDCKFVLPSRRHISDVLLPNAYQTARQLLQVMLQSVRFCALATDTWTSSVTEGYITVTCHFIHCKKLMSAVITTEKIEGSHTAEHLKDVLSEVIAKWEIKGKVTTIVTDNAANIVAATNLLKIKHMPCFAHTLNLVVKDALSTNPELRNLIKRIKDIVTFFNSSTVASDKLRSLQKEKDMAELRLIQSVTTRWNSELAMIRRYLKLRELTTMVIISLKKGPSASVAITTSEAEALGDVVKLLEPFEDATTEISGDQYVTISLVIPLIHGITLKLDTLISKMDTPIGEQMLKELKQSVSKRLFPYEQRTTAMVASLVDPRFKKSAFRVKDNANNAQTLLTTEVSSFISMSPQAVETCNTEIQSTPDVGGKGLLSFVLGRRTPVLRTSQSDAIISIRQYLEGHLIQQTCDPISFWFENKNAYETFSTVSLKYLSVPATSVPSERSFSAAGEILNDRRSRLKPKKVDMLVFLQKNQFLLDE